MKRRNDHRFQKKRKYLNDKKIKTTNEVNKAPVKQPNVYSLVFGSEAKPEIRIVLRTGKNHVKIRDIQGLITWLLADGVNPVKWISIKHKALVSKVVVVMLESLSSKNYHQGLFSGSFQKTEDIFSRVHPSVGGRFCCRIPGSKDRIFSSLTTLLQVPLNTTEKKKQKKNRAEVQKIQIESLLLSKLELLSNGFPIRSTYLSHELQDNQKFNESEFIEYLETRDSQLEVLALDCEMCITSEGFELTRVSVVDEQKNVLYDELVKPKNPILDYVTRYSGITAEDMMEVTTTLSDVQFALSQWIGPNTILVGHSLENDLKALKIFHSKVVDTSVIYPHPTDGCKQSLKYLSEKYLNLSIQNKSHDSVQDAIATLELLKLKLKNGAKFGIPEIQTESLFDVLHRNAKKSVYIDSIDQCQKIGKKEPMNIISTQNDEETLERTLKSVTDPNISFVFTHFYKLSHLQDFEEEEKKNLIFSTYDSYIHEIYQKLAQNTFLIVLTGQPSFPNKKDFEEKNSCQNEIMKEKLEKRFLETVAVARNGISFFAVKH